MKKPKLTTMRNCTFFQFNRLVSSLTGLEQEPENCELNLFSRTRLTVKWSFDSIAM